MTSAATAVRACTIVARNYLPFARVLARTYLQHHPDDDFEVLVIDDRDREVSEAGEPFEVRPLGEIDLDETEQLKMAMMYDATELATAVKPWLLRRLLKEGASAVLYFDPDIAVYASLNDLSELAEREDIVLTPHTTKPMPRDGRRPSETDIMMSGTYNLGFIGVGSEALPMLDWWSVRLARDAISDPSRQLFTDQRWIDLIPGYFRHCILRDATCNVAYWNLYSREIAWDGDRYLVNGYPLRFFHFSGFNPLTPEILSSHPGKSSRITPSDQPGLQRLCQEYAQRLLDYGFGAPREPYGFGELRDGLPIDLRMRRLYRRTLLDFEADQGPEPPNPFADSGRGHFETWLREPPSGDVDVSRYLYEIYLQRPDLQATFPVLRGTGARGFLRWIRARGTLEANVPPALVPSESDLRLTARSRRFAHRPRDYSAPPAIGVNVAGYFRAELGVGEAARLLATGVEAAGEPFVTVTYDKTLSRQEHLFDDRAISRGAIYDVNIVCVNADMTPSFARDMGEQFFRDRYTIGLWFWETEDLPQSMHGAFEYVDEVWVGSTHTHRAIANVSPRPVHVLPLPIVPPDAVTADRGELGLPEGFLFYFSFDFLSIFDRKNPIGLVEAFSRAFRPGEGPRLLVKSINGDRNPSALARLRLAAAGRDDITIWDGYVDSEKRMALTAACDCYVSLHRAEGFGLTIAEAMALGKPVIATRYSGNVDFMTDETTFPVRYMLNSIGTGSEPYLSGSRWAYPDLDHAAELMREVFHRPEEAAKRGQRARRHMLTSRSPEIAGAFIRGRLAAVRGDRDRWLSRGYQALTGRGQQPASSLTELSSQLPTRRGGLYGVAARAARWAVFRLLQPYDVLKAQEVDRLSQEISALRAQVESLSQARASSPQPGGLSAGQVFGPAFTTTDAFGMEAIGYRDFGIVDEADRVASLYKPLEGVAATRRPDVLVPILAERTPVLDIACGDGQMLDLLAKRGVAASGADVDPALVDSCRARGHHVELMDCIEFLDQHQDGSVGSIFAGGIADGHDHERLRRVFTNARRKLVAGGRLIYESANPHSAETVRLSAASPTGRVPVSPGTAVALCQESSFERAIVIFPGGTGELRRDLYERPVYAVIATTSSGRSVAGATGAIARYARVDA